MAEYVAKRDRTGGRLTQANYCYLDLMGFRKWSAPGTARRSDQPLNVRRHEYPVVARGNRRLKFASRR
jgi:hypothetical protein